LLKPLEPPVATRRITTLLEELFISTFLRYKVSSIRHPTPWRIIRRASWSPSDEHDSLAQLFRLFDRADGESVAGDEKTLGRFIAV
jgi:hypothetical protein